MKSVASAMDLPDSLGLVWFSFSKDMQPERVATFRDRVMHRISARRPQTTRLPVMSRASSLSRSFGENFIWLCGRSSGNGQISG
jgi:hypothetical protein